MAETCASRATIQEMLDAKGLAIPRGLHSRVEVYAKELWAERGRNMSWLFLIILVPMILPPTPVP